MTIEVSGPDGAIHEFPDNTPAAFIGKAMRDHYGAKGQLQSEEQARAVKAPKETAGQFIGKTIHQVAAGIPFADRIAAAAQTAMGRGPYAENLEKVRGHVKQYEEEHPYISTAAEIAGGAALPIGAIGAVAKGASLGQKAISGVRTGAGIGALFGAGASPDLTDIPQTAVDTGLGALGGAALGGALPVAARGVGLAAEASGIPQTIRGALNPEREALRHIGTALQADEAARTAQIARRAAQGEPVGEMESARLGLSPGEFAQTNAPAVIADMGGEATRRLARAASNISPEAGSILKSETAHRFEGQAHRIADELVGLGAGDTTQRLEKIKALARRENAGNYAKSYAEGNRPIFSPEIERLTGSPDVLEAMKAAATTGKSRAIVEGMGAFRPGVEVTEDGRVLFMKGPNGAPTYPNLQYWDYVKRELDASANRAARSGDKEAAGRLRAQAKMLRSELDKHVPSYVKTRSVAERAFGASDALEAGQNFVHARGENSVYRKDLAAMRPAERKLFAHGFVSELSSQVREGGLNRNQIIRNIFSSPAAKERIEMALGKDKARSLESALHVENVMQQLNAAVTGNSTTGQQLMDIARHGGMLGTGLHGVVKMFMKAGAKGVDQNVMQKVAEGLVSRDPQTYDRAMATVEKHPSLRSAFIENAPDILRSIGISGGASLMRER